MMRRDGGAPVAFEDPDRVADAIIARVGKNIVLALPLGLGKANHVANALFARAAADPSISLRIFTALTLEKPRSKGDLERRFLEPVADRVFAGYPELAYALALRAGTLPPNVKVDEFFFAAGTRLGIAAAQQSYICANYTHALRYVLDRGVNVVAQLVAKRVRGGETRLSLELQPRPHARSAGVPRAQRVRLPLRRRGQFGAAVHARRRRHRGLRIRPDAGRTGHRLSLVRAAARAHRSCRIRRGLPCGAHGGRRRHLAARHRIARRRGGACTHPAASTKRGVSQSRGAARSRRNGAGGSARKRAVRDRPLRRERDVRRGLSRSDVRGRAQARGRRRVAAGGVLLGLARVLPRAARDAASRARQTAHGTRSRSSTSSTATRPASAARG